MTADKKLCLKLVFGRVIETVWLSLLLKEIVISPEQLLWWKHSFLWSVLPLTMFNFIAGSSNDLTPHVFRRRGKNLIAAHNCRRKKLNEAEVMSQIS